MISNNTMTNIKVFFYFIVICTFLSGLGDILFMSCVNYYKTNNLKIPSYPLYFYYRDVDKMNLPLKYTLYLGNIYLGFLIILSPILYLLDFKFVSKSYFKDKDYLIFIIIFIIIFFFYYYIYDVNVIRTPNDHERNQYLNKLEFSFFR